VQGLDVPERGGGVGNPGRDVREDSVEVGEELIGRVQGRCAELDGAVKDLGRRRSQGLLQCGWLSFRTK
jgi:hypothetical protein